MRTTRQDDIAWLRLLGDLSCPEDRDRLHAIADDLAELSRRNEAMHAALTRAENAAEKVVVACRVGLWQTGDHETQASGRASGRTDQGDET